MTVSTTSAAVSYAGDGSSTTFAVPFQFHGLAVYAVTASTATLLTLAVHYSITGGNGSTGSVVAVTAPAVGTSWRIFRETPQTQTTAISDAGPFPAAAFELAYDKLTMMAQEAAEKASRAMSAPPYETASMVLPRASTRANKLLVFDSAGVPTVADIPGAGTSLTGDASLATVTATGSTTPRMLAERFADVVHVRDFGAVGDGVTDDYAAIQAAIDTGRAVSFRSLDYAVSRPLILRTAGQILYGEGGGYGYGATGVANYSPLTRLIATGTAERRVMTRRNYRASAADPDDASMSALIDVEAEGVQIRDITLWLDCDYTDTSPTNFGADWDIGLFVGCRLGFQERNLQVIGYWRVASRYFDVTRGSGIPELLDYDGVALPAGQSGQSGGDGTHLWNPTGHGGRIGIAVLGALHPGSGTYYDAVTSTTYTDTRGGSGMSDFQTYGGRINGPQHHSGRRLEDPIAAPLTQSNLNAEPDDAPASLYIDGWADNSGSTTHGLGAIRGMCFFGTRFVSREAFRIRLGLCDEIYFVGRGWIESGEGPHYDTLGSVIDVSDYTDITYGHIAAHSTNTGYVEAEHVTGGVFQTWLQDGKFGATSGAGLARRTGLFVEGDSSTLGSISKALAEIRDIHGSPTEKGGLHIQSRKPKIRLEDLSSAASDFDIVADGDNLDFRYGTAAVGTALATSGVKLSASSGAWYPGADGTHSLGLSSARWSALYATTVRTGDGTTEETSGTGSPEGSVAAVIGSRYWRGDGGAGTRLYFKTTGTGNTGWSAIL